MGEGHTSLMKSFFEIKLEKKRILCGLLRICELYMIIWKHVNIFKQPNSFTSLTSFSIQSIQFAFEFMKQLKNFILSLMSAI